jgi:hypothetical protein
MWTYSGGKAQYSGASGVALTQVGVMTIGSLYHISFTISGMTQGKLVLNSFEGQPEYTANGDYSFFGTAILQDVTFIGGTYVGGVFDGALDSLTVRFVPSFVIKDTEDAVIFTSDENNVTANDGVIQYEINWEEIEEGHYKLYMTDGGLTYESDCLFVKTSHPCTKLLTWSNNDNAFGFDASLDFIQSLRVNCKQWQPSYKKTKEVFEDSQGNISILRSSVKKVELLTVSEMPQYLHDALSIGIEHDNFSIDGIPYVVEEEEYTPSWRKSSQLAPVEISVIKKTQNLVNENCV